MAINDGFSSLGDALGQAANAMAEVEIYESKQEAEQTDTKNRNQMYRDYLNRVDELKQTKGRRLTSYSIKRKAYRDVIDKWKGSSVDISNFQAKVASGSGVNQFSTTVDDYMSVVDEMGMAISPKDFRDPEKRDEATELIQRYAKAQQIQVQESITEKEATIVWRNKSNALSASLSSQLNTINKTMSGVTAGRVSPEKAVKKITDVFDTYSNKLDKLRSDLSEKGHETVGNNIMKRQQELEQMKNQYLNNVYALQKARAGASKAETEAEVAESDATVDYYENKIELKKALIKNEALNTDAGKVAQANLALYEGSGLELPPTVAEELYKSVSKAAKSLDIETIKYKINQLNKNNADYNVINTFVPKDDLSQEAVNKVVPSVAAILNKTSRYLDTIQSDTATSDDKVQAVNNLSVELGALTMDNTLTNVRKYMDKAHRKYQDNEDVTAVYNYIGNMFKDLQYVQEMQKRTNGNLKELFGVNEGANKTPDNEKDVEIKREDYESTEAYTEALNNRER